SVLEANRRKFPARPGLFTIDQLGLGGWRKVQRDFFDPDKGVMATIERKVEASALASAAVTAPARAARPVGERAGTALSLGAVTTFLGLVVALPLAALGWRSASDGPYGFWTAVSSPGAVAALELTLGASLVVALINAVLGTVTAWVLVRDDFRGRALVDAIVDLPFALPTIVAGLTLLALYGPRSPIGVDVAYTRAAIVLALLFVTLPF